MCQTLIRIPFLSFLFLSGCGRHANLENSEWITIKFSVDETRLSAFERVAYNGVHTPDNLHIEFTDSLALAFVEGAPIDTSIYERRKDTVFYIHGNKRDTSLILKLTTDSLIEQSLSGIRTYSIRLAR